MSNYFQNQLVRFSYQLILIFLLRRSLFETCAVFLYNSRQQRRVFTNMPHTALYRKIRPKTFRDVVGQQHIIRALCNQVTAGQVSHAYLFCGTRGTGKTSIARILARAVNCEDPQDGNPCNTCESCQGIFAERNLNVVEIDAASNNGVENIRDLREEVRYQPTQGRYKVYIIDEVHMLSTSAFNALLKTLEEPPAYVIFILATTDSQKLPATILSRCQRYDFRRIAVSEIISTLKKYLEAENLEYEDKALDYIAYHSDGAMRDALSLLDQSLSLGDSRLTYNQVLDMLGAVDRSRLFEFTDALNAADSMAAMAVIDTAMDGGRDASQFTADLVRHFRDVLVAGLVSDPNAIDFSAEIATQLKEQGRRVSPQNLMEYIHTFSETLREMRFAPHARTALEVCALRVCVPRVETPVSYAQPVSTAVPVAVEKPAEAEKPISKLISDITPGTLDNIVASWAALCTNFPNPMRSMCAQCGLENNDGKLELVMASATMRDILKPKETIIREAIADKFKLSTPPNLAFIVREGYNKPVTLPEKITEVKIEPEPEFVQPSIPTDWVQEPEPEIMQSIPSDWAQATEPTENAEQPDDWGAVGIEMITDESW